MGRRKAKPELLPPDTPSLSVSLTGPRHPLRCSSCARELRELDVRTDYEALRKDGWPADIAQRWAECDAADRPTNRVIVLCSPCSARLIEPHPLLYRDLQQHQPHPGSMPLCADCRHRDGLRCTHPDAKANGGPGVGLNKPGSDPCHVNQGGGKGYWFRMFRGPVTVCRGREVSANE